MCWIVLSIYLKYIRLNLVIVRNPTNSLGSQFNSSQYNTYWFPGSWICQAHAHFSLKFVSILFKFPQKRCSTSHRSRPPPFPIVHRRHHHCYAFRNLLFAADICWWLSFTTQWATLLTVPYNKKTSTNSVTGLLSGKFMSFIRSVNSSPLLNKYPSQISWSSTMWCRYIITCWLLFIPWCKSHSTVAGTPTSTASVPPESSISSDATFMAVLWTLKIQPTFRWLVLIWSMWHQHGTSFLPCIYLNWNVQRRGVWFVFKLPTHHFTCPIYMLSPSDVWSMTLNCIHIFIVTGSFLYWCVMRSASQRFFIRSCVYLRIFDHILFSNVFGTNSLAVLMCRKAVIQSIAEMRLLWLRIGYTYLTHGHLLQGETPPRCLSCQVDLTVEHVLLHCVSFTNAREKFSVLLWPPCLNYFRKSPHVQ